MSDQEAEHAQREQELQARVNRLVNNLPYGAWTIRRAYHAALEAAEHYGYTGKTRQYFADLAASRYAVIVEETERQREREMYETLGGCFMPPGRQETSMPHDTPPPTYHQGERVTVWIAGISPCNAIIRRPDRVREGEWWYLCTMGGMFGAEHLAPMPEGWICRPGEGAPRRRNLASNDDQTPNEN